ncbi:MAG: DUF3575 domain-containing protein, partial [Paramuribaculum sp.]|nr:DUF3575 domain-containing protein [Paramuribaculum sp.]
MKGAVVILLSAVVSLATSVSAEEVSDSTVIYFHQGRSIIEKEYRNNGARLDSLVSRLGELSRDSLFRLKHVKVVGSASPEGSVRINKRLSDHRAENLYDYISKRVCLPDSMTRSEFVGRDWAGLYAQVENDSAVPYRQDVLGVVSDILDSLRDGQPDNGGNLRRIMDLHSGIPYGYMYRHLFPDLRVSRLYVVYETARNLYPLTAVDGDVFMSSVALTPVMPDVRYVRSGKPFYMALKTNMLYDAAALPNIGAEFYVGKNWSVGADWMYGWWDNDSRHRYWRAYGGDVVVRRWFGEKAEEKPLTGHHAGVFAGVVTYDFEFGGQGYMGGLPGRTLWDRCNVVAGVEYGYSLPVGRRINIDFTIGVGYIG